MLVLSRRQTESLQIGDVTIYVQRLRRGRVRLAIDAPPDVRVVRSELLESNNQGRPARPRKAVGRCAR